MSRATGPKEPPSLVRELARLLLTQMPHRHEGKPHMRQCHVGLHLGWTGQPSPCGGVCREAHLALRWVTDLLGCSLDDLAPTKAKRRRSA